MENKFEQLGIIIDELESLTLSLTLPIGDRVHVEMLRAILPEKVQKLKEVFVEITGENPWE